WPNIRVEEAWRDGLDVIALTDHLEYLPHKLDIPTNFARPYEIARSAAAPLGLVVIRAAEITRGEPPGHLNALFLTNVAALNQKDYRVAVSNAYAQGAFLFWNHPGWKQPERKAVWYAEQGEFLAKGYLRGIEIVNGPDYESLPHQWALEKQLTLLGDSDAHDPIGFEYSSRPGEIRPVTLVFSKARTPESIREALFARRTVVFSRDQLFGEAQFLDPLFQGSLEILTPCLRLRGKSSGLVQIRNKAPLNFALRLNPKVGELVLPEELVLAAGKVSLLPIRCVSERATGEQELQLPCKVLNLHAAPDQGLDTQLRVKVQFEPAN
ncbi:MAG TPA: Sb-PDE family phosphodiesterase, partial [Bacillota bacterium]|nr:Sb-PDE family phosphodiesterase [Bacillota bacterium]